MADFEREFKVKHVVRLEQNYRSHGNILDAANALIANNRNRLGKNLWTSAGKGEPVRVFEGESDNDEARWIVSEVQALARDGTRLSQVAVLYRSNAQSRVVEHALFSQGIPYRVYGGLRFFERAEIKHALAYLRLLATPDDDSSFLRVANFPPRGIGARTMEQLQDTAKQAGASLMKVADGSKAAVFKKLIDDLRAETQGLPLSELVEVAIARSGLVEHYKTEREGADRIENLAELVTAATTFTEEERVSESGEAVDPLTAFLTHAALEAGEHQAGEGQEALQMMTVHSAKGLEFDAVFMTGLEEGLFPHEQSAMERDGLEEERRLAYVAITRARHRLYLSHAQTRMLHGQTRYNIPSRFLEEIPQPLLKWLTPRFSKQKAFAPDFSRQTQDHLAAGKACARCRRLQDRAERHASQVRRRRHRRPGRTGRGRAGAGQLPRPRPQAACACRGQAAGRLADVVLGQGERLGFRSHDVVELRELDAVLERRVVVEAVEHRGHPPGEMLGAPDPLQRGGGVGIQRLARPWICRYGTKRCGQHPHIVHGEVQPLRARRRHDVGGIAGEEEAPVAHRLDHEAAHRDDAFLEDAALRQGPAFAGRQARVQLFPDARIRPVLHLVLRVALEVKALDLR